MNPSIPQTEAQTEVIESVPESIWKMDGAMYAELVKQLTASGAKFNENGLRHVIDDMESKTQVEYGILVEDHDGNPDTYCKSAFVSYGSFTLMSYNQVVNTCRNRGGDMRASIHATPYDPVDVLGLRLWHELLHAVGQPADNMSCDAAEWQTPFERILWHIWRVFGAPVDIPFWQSRYYAWLTARAEKDPLF